MEEKSDLTCTFFPALVLRKFEAHSQTHRKLKGSGRELHTTHKTTTILPSDYSLTAAVFTSLSCTEPSLQEHPCSHCTSNQKPFPDTNWSESTRQTHRSHLWCLHFLGSLSTGEEKHWRAAAPLGTLLNRYKQHRAVRSQHRALSSRQSTAQEGEGAVWAMRDSSHLAQAAPQHRLNT